MISLYIIEKDPNYHDNYQYGDDENEANERVTKLNYRENYNFVTHHAALLSNTG